MLPLLTLWLTPAAATTATMASLCGTWTEQGGCEDSSCSGATVFSRSSLQFLQTSEAQNAINYYTSTLHHFQDEFCEYGGKEDLMNITVDGIVLLGSDHQQWTSVEYLPTTLTVYVDEKAALISTSKGDQTFYEFPDETCSETLLYLNKYCPCDGQWLVGTKRTITFSDCSEDTCTAFENIQQYGKIQMPVEGVLTMSHRYTIEAQAHTDPRIESVLMKVDNEGCMEQSKYYTPKLGAGGGNNDDKDGEREEDKEGEDDKGENERQEIIDDSSSSSSSRIVNVTNSILEEVGESSEGINALLVYAAIGIGAAVGMVITGTWYYIASKKELSTEDYQSIQDPQVHQTFT